MSNYLIPNSLKIAPFSLSELTWLNNEQHNTCTSGFCSEHCHCILIFLWCNYWGAHILRARCTEISSFNKDLHNVHFSFIFILFSLFIFTTLSCVRHPAFFTIFKHETWCFQSCLFILDVAMWYFTLLMKWNFDSDDNVMISYLSIKRRKSYNILGKSTPKSVPFWDVSSHFYWEIQNNVRVFNCWNTSLWIYSNFLRPTFTF